MKTKKQENLIVKNYRESFDYIKRSKNFIYYVIFLFLFSALIGFFVPLPESIMTQVLDFVKELLEKTQGMSQFELTSFIFLNNVQSSFMGVLFGIFLGIYPIIAAILNGFIIGFVASMSVGLEGVGVLWRLVPHGVFELPAIFISFGIGLKLGTFIFQKNKLKTFRDYLLNSFKVFVFVIIPLLFVAAIIEGTLVFFFS